MGPFLEKERLLFYFFPGKNSSRKGVVWVGNDRLCGAWLRACVYLPEDKLAQWTMGRLTSIASPPGYIPGDSAQGKDSGCERVCLSYVSISLVMLRAKGLVRGHLSTPATTPPWRLWSRPLQRTHHSSGCKGPPGVGVSPAGGGGDACILKLQGAPFVSSKHRN